MRQDVAKLGGVMCNWASYGPLKVRWFKNDATLMWLACCSEWLGVRILYSQHVKNAASG